MIVEMLALLIIAVVVFAYVLAPIVLPRRDREIPTEDTSVAGVDGEDAEAVVPEKQPVHDLS